MSIVHQFPPESVPHIHGFSYCQCADCQLSRLSVPRGVETAPKNHIEENKPMPTLIPLDVLIEYLEPAYREGLQKYYRESWRGGFPVSVMIDAALRHIVEFFYRGEDVDPDSTTGKHHLSGAIFSLICVLWTLKVRPDLDDRRKEEGK